MARNTMTKVAGALAGAVTIALLTAAAPASAAPADAGTSAIDCLDIGLTHRNGNDIVGYGSIRRACSGRADIVIQWSRWWGWQDVKAEIVNGPGYDHYVRWNCTNSGTHDFRTIIKGTIAGNYQSKISNTITASC